MEPVHINFPTPDYPYPVKIPFSQWEKKAPPSVEDLGVRGKSDEDRQCWFEEQIRRMAADQGGKVPWAFQFSDKRIFQLDKGCVGMAIKRNVLRRPPEGQPMEFLELLAKGEVNPPRPPKVVAPRTGTLRPGSRATHIADGVKPRHVHEAASFIDDHSRDEVLEYAGTQAWARDSHVLVDGRKYPTKILSVIAKRKATHERLHPRYAHTEDFERALAHLGFHRPEEGGQVLERIERQAEQSGDFDPNSVEDARTRVTRAIVQRRGNSAFRKALLAAYEKRCAVTGCDLVEALEAAHIVPYKGDQTNHITNGLLLRADIHTLFDLNLIAFDPKTLKVRVSATIAGTAFADHLKGLKLQLPRNPELAPNVEALQARLKKLL